MNELEQSLINSPTLPTVPKVAQRLLELIQDENVTLSDLQDLISVDVALSAKIIRLINSPLYGLSREVLSIKDAALYLGLNTVRSIALSFSLLSTFSNDAGKDDALDAIWQTSLMNALATRRLASEFGGWDPEEAFLSGLLADCGVLLFHLKLPEYAQILQRFEAGEADLLELEQTSLGTSHARIGGLLLDAWKFPTSLSEIVSLHHDTEAAHLDSPIGLRVRTLHAAWQYARTLTVSGFTSGINQLEQRVSAMVGIPPTPARTLAMELPDELRETIACFEIPADRVRSYEDLLAEATQMLGQTMIEADQSAKELAEELAAGRRAFGDLRDRVTDPEDLDEETGLLNELAFEQLLESYHSRAKGIRRPIGLLIMTVENFKSISESEGREVALEGLRQISERASHLTRQTDQWARFAENQIALLAPGCSSNNLRRAAERLRFGVEERALETSSGALPCQVAIGVAATNPHEDAVDFETLLGFASYAAKQAEHDAERIVLAV